MPPENKVLQYDIVISGAGPAGCACALALAGAGLSVALLDKANFPRDKVCGDAIPGRAIKTLKHINPLFEDAFKNFAKKLATRKTTLYYKKRKTTFSWVREAYTCTRFEFDNFLYSLVLNNTSTDIYLNTHATSYEKNDAGFSIITKNSAPAFNTHLLIACDGAQSIAAKQLAGKTLDRAHHVGSVRGYFTNVSNLPADTTELYFDKKYLPSYLWIFPLPGNTANVGFGMLSSEIARRKVNIRKTFYDFIDSSPILKEKFRDATQQGGLEGFGLPLGSKPGTISGERFMLAGDAASLIDPISGDGIGNAMLSGMLAAQQAVKCFAQNDFTAPHMRQYDNTVFTALGNELKTHYNAQRILAKMPYLLDIIFVACKNKWLKELIRKQL